MSLLDAMRDQPLSQWLPSWLYQPAPVSVAAPTRFDFITPAPPNSTATPAIALTALQSTSSVRINMTASAIFATIRALLPVIRFAIETIEESGLTSGSEKLTAALALIKDMVSEGGLADAWDAIEPKVKQTIAALVAFWNLTGKFRKKG